MAISDVAALVDRCADADGARQQPCASNIGLPQRRSTVIAAFDSRKIAPKVREQQTLRDSNDSIFAGGNCLAAGYVVERR
jgi:hypothetical protein